MTTVVAWEQLTQRSARSIAEDAEGQPRVSELIFASDSRLSGGQRWDANVKIFSVGREDCLLAFAGDTLNAHPLIFQAISASNAYEGSKLRTLDIQDFLGQLINVLSDVYDAAKERVAPSSPDCEFLFGGWSWSLGRFLLYKVFYDEQIERFSKSTVTSKPQSLNSIDEIAKIGVIGDGRSKYLHHLDKVVRSTCRVNDNEFKIGLSVPLEALYRQTLSRESNSVGGPIQAGIVSQRICVEHLAVKVEDTVTISGRMLMDKERTNLRCLERVAETDWRVSKFVHGSLQNVEPN